MSEKFICIHGHFYQPPRENPWLEEVELQDSAYPYHDWNERISEECYAPNTASRILDHDGRIIDIVNNYSKISFNFGPTLLSWMEIHQERVYRAVIEADRLSRERFSGHGSALAQVYNHMIMPLASKEDKRTQVLWGLEDFRSRFERDPEGMWLPETAVDTPTLEVLAENGIKFTILSQRQADAVRRVGGDDWEDVNEAGVDPSRSYLVNLPSGNTINVFYYDGPIAHDISFGGLLRSGEAFAKRLNGAFIGERDGPQLVHIATDGETYGHHHRHGEMALSYCLYRVESESGARITNYGEFLEIHPPEYETRIHEKSSWSCVHGVERWRSDCGCSSGMHHGWNQKWRKPLRDALDRLRDRLASLYEKEASGLIKDPWAARDDYIRVVLDRDPERVEEFLEKHAAVKTGDGQGERVSTLKLLEMQRNAMLMYTSCGWFFDELSGIETVQVMQYAAQAIQYAEEVSGSEVEKEFLGMLANASSNVLPDGAAVYEKHVRPARVDLLRVGAHYAISSLFEEYNTELSIFSYSGTSDIHDRAEAGRSRLLTGKATLRSDITSEAKDLTFAVLHLGEQNLSAGVREYRGEEECGELGRDLSATFRTGDTTGVILKMDRNFSPGIYSIWHLFRDEQRKVISRILQVTYEEIEAAYRHIYEDNYGLMDFLTNLEMPLSRPLEVSAEYIVNLDIKRVFESEGELDTDRLERKIDQLNRWSLTVDRTTMEFIMTSRINSMMECFESEPSDLDFLSNLETALGLIVEINVAPDLWGAQNVYFRTGRGVYPEMKEKSREGDGEAKAWVAAFERLGGHLRVKVD